MKLLTLNHGTNNLTEGIPAFLVNLSSIKQHSPAYNNLEGIVLDEIGELKSTIQFAIGPNILFGMILTQFALGPNNLSGIILASLYNASSINTISVIDNKLYSTLPPTISLTLPNLHHFGIGGNEFSRNIPKTLSNASKLQILEISENNFVGQALASFENLQCLKWPG